MESVVLYLIIFIIFLIVGGSIWLVYLYLKEDDESVEEPFILNLMPNHSVPVKGHAIGLEVSCITKDEKYLIEYSPRDIDKVSLRKTNGLIPNIKVVADKNHIVVFPKGTLSNFRTIKIILAPTPEDYGSELKRHLFGQVLMNLTEAINLCNDESKIVREGSRRKTDLLYKMGDGELSNEIINKFTEINKDLLKSFKDSDNKSNNPSFPPR